MAGRRPQSTRGRTSSTGMRPTRVPLSAAAAGGVVGAVFRAAVFLAGAFVAVFLAGAFFATAFFAGAFLAAFFAVALRTVDCSACSACSARSACPTCSAAGLATASAAAPAVGVCCVGTGAGESAVRAARVGSACGARPVTRPGAPGGVVGLDGVRFSSCMAKLLPAIGGSSHLDAHHVRNWAASPGEYRED
ncbi:hypothetical protein C7M71_021015 [Peterkaempfera bronchialis]|uniref:Uncharacterized protein n=1 Tax=Peterkaempfera bronchialis TaxID=2126346 RepID=A0A345T0L6_9ACTN|nr:hypothetical protein C7M71_021015 [Peterkaempfera bronchialis]